LLIYNADIKIIKIITKSPIKKKINGGISLNTEVKEVYKDDHMNYFFENNNKSYA